MTYIKNTWTDNDIITAEKLNHIDEGIINSSVPVVQLTLGSLSETEVQLNLNITPYKIINNIFTFERNDGEIVDWFGFFYVLDNTNSDNLIHQIDNFHLTNENDVYTLSFFFINGSIVNFTAENLNSFFQGSQQLLAPDNPLK